MTPLPVVVDLTVQAARALPGRDAREIERQGQHLAWRLVNHRDQQGHRLGVLTILHLELANLDGYPATASGSDAQRHAIGVISRPVERTVIARQGDEHRIDGRWRGRPGPADDLAALTDLIETAYNTVQRGNTEACRLAIEAAHRICNRHTPTNDPHDPDRYRCRGTGDEHGAACTRIADYRIGDHGVILPLDGRCPQCRTAVEEREERERLAREAARKRKARR